MAKPIYDPDGHLKNFCVLAKTVWRVLPRAVYCEIYQHVTPFELEEELKMRCKSRNISSGSDPPSMNPYEQDEKDINLSFLCQILQSFQLKQIQKERATTYTVVSPKDVNEIQTLMKELYVFEEESMVPTKEFTMLWQKVKRICKIFDCRSLPKLISYWSHCRLIKKTYSYGEEQDICSLVRKHWALEADVVKNEVIYIRSLQNKLSSIRKHSWMKSNMCSNFQEFFRKIRDKIRFKQRNQAEEWSEKGDFPERKRQWSITSLQSKIVEYNELLSDESSILEMNMPDTETAVKQLMDVSISSESKQSVAVKKEAVCSEKFCILKDWRTVDSLGKETKQSEFPANESKMEMCNFVSDECPIVPAFLTRCSLPMTREMGSSFLNSPDRSDFDHPQSEPTSTGSPREEDFANVRNKHCMKMMKNVECILLSPEGLLFTLKNSVCKDPVLILNVNLISASIVKETTMDASLISKDVSSYNDRLGSDEHCKSLSETDDSKAIRLPAENNKLFCEDPKNCNSVDVNQNTMNKYCLRKEKYELRKQLSKRLYMFLCKDGTSKKKYHQKIRQASIRFLVESFFKHYDEIEKKDINDISKIINHLFKYLSSSSPSSFPLYPIGRDTPSRLEAFFQTFLHNQNVSENESDDSMHFEWMRLQSFFSFPASCKVSTVNLARDGFFYKGHSTETQCFCCRNTYQDWDETSNVNEIHLRISPDCDMANGRTTRNIAIHDQQVNQERATDTRRQHEAEDGATGESSSIDTTQEQPVVSATEGDQEQSGENLKVTTSSSSPKPSKSKLKRERRKKKKELLSANKTSIASLGGLVVSEVPTEDVSHEDPSKRESAESTDAKTASSGAFLDNSDKAESVTGGLQIKEVQSPSNPLSSSSRPQKGFSVSQSETAISAGNTSYTSQSTNQRQSHGKSSSLSPGPLPSETNPPGVVQSGSTTSGASSVGAKTSDPSTSESNESTSAKSGANASSTQNPPGPSSTGSGPPGPSPSERLAQLDPLGINFDRPKYPAYAVYSTRLSSFDGWPSHMAQTPREMARAGYFYAGYGDYARCFFCGGGLRNWDRSDDPWTEHARWFPRCAFLRNNRGNKFVATVQRTHEEQEAGLRPSTRFLNPPERDMDTSAAEALREMGYRDRIIEQAIDQWRRSLWPGRIQPPPLSADRLLDIIEDIQRTEEGRPSEGPLTIPGVHDETVESPDTGCNVGDSAVARATTGEREEDSATTGQREEDSAVALEENRSDDQLVQAQPRDYGYDQKEKQEKQVLEEDYLGLRETLVCKICREKDVAAAFLPCGHLVCCLDCAPAMRKCPTCGEVIKGTVKTYFA